MDPLSLGIMAGGSILGGLFNFLSNSDANARAQMLQDQNLQNFIKIAIPDPQEQQVALEQFVQQGQITPALEQAISQQPSEFNHIFENAKYGQQQNQALDSLVNIGQQGGLNLQDKATLNDLMTKSAMQAKGDRDTITADAARRGIAGSGMSIAAKLASQQGQADRDSNASLQVASDAQQRALQAIMGAGQLAGTIRGQDYQVASDRANANDAINRFNAANLQGVQSRNVGTLNDAQYYNTGQRQQIANMNTNLANQEQMYNKQLVQQNYDNQLKKAQDMSQIYNNKGNLAQAQGQNAGNFASNIGNTISQTAGTVLNNNQMNDWWDKYFKSRNGTQTGQQGGMGGAPIV